MVGGWEAMGAQRHNSRQTTRDAKLGAAEQKVTGKPGNRVSTLLWKTQWFIDSCPFPVAFSLPCLTRGRYPWPCTRGSAAESQGGGGRLEGGGQSHGGLGRGQEGEKGKGGATGGKVGVRRSGMGAKRGGIVKEVTGKKNEQMKPRKQEIIIPSACVFAMRVSE